MFILSLSIKIERFMLLPSVGKHEKIGCFRNLMICRWIKSWTLEYLEVIEITEIS